jgi:hypothetical protein
MRAAVNNGLRRNVPVIVGAQEGDASVRGQRFNHRGVLKGECASCHNGQLARGLSKDHSRTRMSCDACHRSTAWTPAQYGHEGVAPGSCLSCHNGVDAASRPGNHFITVRACDSCHRRVTWTPVNYAHLSPAYRPQPDKLTCVSCHVTNSEVIPRQLHNSPRLRPVPPAPTPAPASGS